MKDFLKYVLATVTGLVFVGMSLLIVIFFVLIMFVSNTNSTSTIQDSSLLHIVLNGELKERKVEDPLSLFWEEGMPQLGLRETILSIERACSDKRIKGIYLKAGTLLADMAAVEELREALIDFKKSGKFIVAYGDVYTQGCYYLCSVANVLVLNPIGEIEWSGLSSQPVFYKDMLEKFGVRMQVFKVGAYKSAVEPFIRTEMSDENRLQVSSFLHSIWNKMVSDVSKSRRISEDSLQVYADRYIMMADPEQMLKVKLTDFLMYESDVKKILRNKVGLRGKKELSLISPEQYLASSKDKYTANNSVAVYYATGDIVSMPIEGMLSEDMICAPKVIDDLEKLAADDHVKAVVLRINSGGGSAYASEQIWNTVRRLNEQKPVVVSMGGMTASGGYYIASGAGYLMADATTLTGSIGIFGIFPDVSELLKDKLGLSFDVTKTNEHADFGTISRPLNQSEQKLLQRYVDRGYQLFLKRVAIGRKMPLIRVDSLAQGRVWTGEQAFHCKLVDGVGTLRQAIKVAAKQSRLSSYRIENYPKPSPWYEKWLEAKTDNYLEKQLRASLGEYYTPFMMIKTLKNRDYVQARMPYNPNIQ